MTTYDSPYLLWADLETTGIDPYGQHASILEIGLVVTEGPELVERAAANVIVRPPGTQLDHDRVWAAMPDKVRTMHEANGLWREATVGNAGVAVHDADDGLFGWLGNLGIHDPISLCGSGVERFDRPWMQQHMPRLFSRLTYYSVWDLGTHRRALQFAGRGDLVDLVVDVDNKPHRALEDARLHVAEARRYTELYRSIGRAREGFDPKVSSTWNDEERAVYDTGYEEGSRSVLDDFEAKRDL